MDQTVNGRGLKAQVKRSGAGRRAHANERSRVDVYRKIRSLKRTLQLLQNGLGCARLT